MQMLSDVCSNDVRSDDVCSNDVRSDDVRSSNRSSKIHDEIIKFYFQCKRFRGTIVEPKTYSEDGRLIEFAYTDKHSIPNLADTLHGLLTSLSNKDEYCVCDSEMDRQECLMALFKLIAQTRDIVLGKGEYAIAHMMICVWHQYYPEMAYFALRQFVISPDVSAEPKINSGDGISGVYAPLGSWKDIKYICKFISRFVCIETDPIDHSLVKYAISLLNEQFRKDVQLYKSSDTQQNDKILSLVAKWIPRETSPRFGWLYPAIAADYFPEYIASAKTAVSKAKAQKKCNAQYRMLLTTLNRHLDTVQIKQCGGKWSEIDHCKTTPRTMRLQRRPFLNISLHDNTVRSKDPDRIQCAVNVRQHFTNTCRNVEEFVSGSNQNLTNGKRKSLDEFGAHAISLVCRRIYEDTEECKILNTQWQEVSPNSNALANYVAMVNTLSSTKYVDPTIFHAAVAMGCRIAEKSILGKRVMTFASNPEWLNLERCSKFMSMVQTITCPDHSEYSTDIYKAFDLILTSIEEKQLSNDEVENMVLVVLSDIQPDAFHERIGNILDISERIKHRYVEAGLRLHGKPYTPPNMLFWNLRNQTDRFPWLSNEIPAKFSLAVPLELQVLPMSIMSGFDPYILDKFCNEGIAGLRKLSGWSMLTHILANDRYRHFDEIPRELLEK